MPAVSVRRRAVACVVVVRSVSSGFPLGGDRLAISSGGHFLCGWWSCRSTPNLSSEPERRSMRSWPNAADENTERARLAASLRSFLLASGSATCLQESEAVLMHGTEWERVTVATTVEVTHVDRENRTSPAPSGPGP